MRLLEAEGYLAVSRAASSKGLIDVWAAGPQGTRCVQVKRGERSASKAERERLEAFAAQVPSNVIVEIWWFRPGSGTPEIRRV